jgi:hypothetical protein
MSTVYTAASVSLDGFIAGPRESGFDQLFQWLNNGDVVAPTGDRDFHMTPASAALWNEGPKQIVRGDRITHLRYRIVK